MIVAGTLCVVADGMGGHEASEVIISRVIQGIGSVLSMSINFAIAEELFKREE